MDIKAQKKNVGGSTISTTFWEMKDMDQVPKAWPTHFSKSACKIVNFEKYFSKS